MANFEAVKHSTNADENPVWEMFQEKLAPSHRKRAKISADLPLKPFGCTNEGAGWYKFFYAFAFPPVVVLGALVVMMWSGLTMYFTFISDNELFSKAVFDKVHEAGSEYDGNMALFLLHNPKYLAPFMLGLASVYAAYNFTMILPPAVKWFHVVWRREACKNLSVKYATNLLEAVDAAADNMRVWYMHVVVASIFCALLVSPRAAGFCMAVFSFSRLFTAIGMFFDNPIPQTLLMATCTAFMFRFMLFASIHTVTRDLLPEWLYMVLSPALDLDVALSI
jgi:hypothetical protein